MFKVLVLNGRPVRKKSIVDGYDYTHQGTGGNLNAQAYRPDRTSENHRDKCALAFATCTGAYTGLIGKYETFDTLRDAEKRIEKLLAFVE